MIKIWKNGSRQLRIRIVLSIVLLILADVCLAMDIMWLAIGCAAAGIGYPVSGAVHKSGA